MAAYCIVTDKCTQSTTEMTTHVDVLRKVHSV